MEQLTCIIVDDEPLACQLMESYVSRIAVLQSLGTFTSSTRAFEFLQTTPVNLVFLDIQMPNLSGMELSRLLPAGTRVVFTTAFRQYALEGYEVSALDYLLKPIKYTSFLAAVEKARQWFFGRPSVATPAHDSLFLRVDGEIRPVRLDDILYVSGLKDYVRVSIKNEPRPLTTHLMLRDIEPMLPAPAFLRINRSVIIATAHIRSIDRNNCIYIADEVFRVGETYQDQFRRFLASRMASK